MSLEQNTTSLQEILDAVNALPEAGSGEPTLQEKTVTPTTSSQTVTPDSSYDGLSKVTVNAMPTATQSTPSITVSSAGKITASSTQSAGYVTGGTKTATKQLTTQGAQTITPGTSNKTIASGRYLTGTQTIKGDANLVPANIAEGITIFGVTGTHSGGGGAVETCTVTLSGGNISLIGVDANGQTMMLNDGTTNSSAWSFDVVVAKNTLVVAFDAYYYNPLNVSGGEPILCEMDVYWFIKATEDISISL